MADDKAAAAAPAEAVDDSTALAQQAEKQATGKGPLMAIKVYAPFKVYYEGEAYSVTALNESGPFDVLPHHRNFLCMLLPCDLVIKTPYDVQTIKISRALMHVKADKVTVFVDV